MRTYLLLIKQIQFSIKDLLLGFLHGLRFLGLLTNVYIAIKAIYKAFKPFI